MEKIVCTLTIEVDEPTKNIDVHMDFDCDDFPQEWEEMSMTQKIAATFQVSAGEIVKSVLKHEKEKETKQPVGGGIDDDDYTSDGIKYPCRCRIIDPEGEKVFEDATHEAIALANPSVAVPKVGRLGWAHKEGSTVRIELDDGSTLMGYECWWEPIADVN